MDKKKAFLLIISIYLVSACASNNSSRSDHRLPLPDEQCKILFQKRQVVKGGNSTRMSARRNQRAHPGKTPANSPTQAKIQSETFSANDSPFSVSPELLLATNASHIIIFEKKSFGNKRTLDDDTLTNEDAVVTPVRFREEPHSPIPLSNQNPANISYADKTKTADITGDPSLPALAGISALLGIALLGLTQRRSKAISGWAARNPWTARGLIASIHIGATLGALAIGDQLSQQGVVMAETANMMALTLFTTSALFYPIVNSRYTLFRSSYFRQKVHDIILFTSGTAMMMFVGNHYAVTTRPNAPAEQVIYSFASLHSPDVTTSIVKKDFSTIVKKQDPPSELTVSQKVALTILAVLVFVLLSWGVALLACGLACDGAEGLAYAVLFGGGAGLIFALIVAIRGIFGKRTRNKQKERLQSEGA